MHFFLKAENREELLFEVLDSSESPVYEVVGKSVSLGRRYVLRDADGIPAARMAGVELPSAVRYSISAGSRHIRVMVKPGAARRTVRFKGVCWRFRGSVLTRSFDIVEDSTRMQPRTIMTHGRCWNRRGDWYAIEIPSWTDVPLALCTAVAVDCAVIGGCISPVPVN